ncbi:hypothetical protein [Nocardioides sambongensis]|uniref:hypothetical protein n=1 Tax=Nocardioides sambongensis TaxID=2589074 RepID=UPI0015E8393F|nr:hypothetical protein [Nocardioides sambongensis]
MLVSIAFLGAFLLDDGPAAPLALLAAIFGFGLAGFLFYLGALRRSGSSGGSGRG